MIWTKLENLLNLNRRKVSYLQDPDEFEVTTTPRREYVTIKMLQTTMNGKYFKQVAMAAKFEEPLYYKKVMTNKRDYFYVVPLEEALQFTVLPVKFF